MIDEGSMANATILSEEQRASYRATGYLLVQQVAPEPFLADVQQFLERLVDETIAAWRGLGRLDESCSDEGFASRFFHAWLAAGSPGDVATTFDERFSTRALAGTITEDWILGLTADVLGAERVAPLDASFYRAKFPHDERTNIPWHQDAQCLEPLSGVDFITAWIPLVDVAENNSCLEVSPLEGEPRMLERAWSAQSSYVCMREADAAGLLDVRPIRMRRGDVLLLSPYVPHRSIDNRGTQIRWSVDLRYRPA